MPVRTACCLVTICVLCAAIPALAAQAALLTVSRLSIHDTARNVDVSLRVNAPLTGTNLPLILFSHGAGYTEHDYLPLTEFWASEGYVVIQPSHLELPAGHPDGPKRWRFRILDMRLILDRLDEIEKAVPGLAGRIDRQRILAAGHSFGAHTAASLVGGSNDEPDSALADDRIAGAVLMAPPPHAPGFRNVSWAAGSKPVLIIVGDKDISKGFADRWEDHADYYFKTPVGKRCLAVLAGMQHYLGGILGRNRTEELTPKEESLAQIKAMSLAYFDRLRGAEREWTNLVERYAKDRPPIVADFQCK